LTAAGFHAKRKVGTKDAVAAIGTIFIPNLTKIRHLGIQELLGGKHTNLIIQYAYLILPYKAKQAD
jgi:hypothetical protein